MSTPNNVGFLSSTGLSTSDLTLARKLYDNAASLSFRQASRYANSPLPFVDKRSVDKAASFRFYMYGDTVAPEKEYISGDELLGQDYALQYGDVNVDDIIVAHKSLGRKDARISHIEMAPIWGAEHARVVGVEMDRRLLNQLALCPRQTAATKAGITIHNGGFRVTRSGGSATVATAMTTAYPLSSTGAANLRADLRSLAYTADVNQWPMENRWIVLDAYLKQVLLYDTTGTLFSKDYQNYNEILKRNISVIEGWQVYAWETRASTQGGLLPDSDINTYARSTKFNNNFVPQASNGFPCVIAFVAAGEEQAPVGFGSWIDMQSIVTPQETRHSTLYQTFALCGIEKMRPYSAASIEVIL